LRNPPYHYFRHASSYYDHHFHKQGRLEDVGAWVPHVHHEIGSWYQIATESLHAEQISGVATQGKTDTPPFIAFWTTRVTVQSSMDGHFWSPVDGSKVFTANSDQETVVPIMFEHPIVATYLRIYPVAWEGQSAGALPGLRAGYLDCETAIPLPTSAPPTYACIVSC
jgi:hypothetical protein